MKDDDTLSPADIDSLAAILRKEGKFCITNDGLCSKNDEFCIQNDEFRKVMDLPRGCCLVGAINSWRHNRQRRTQVLRLAGAS